MKTAAFRLLSSGMRKPIVLFLCFLAVAACSNVVAPADKVISQRYDRIVVGPERDAACDSTHRIGATAFSFVPSATKPRNIFDLDGQAQSTLIEVIAGKEGSSADMLRQIGKSFATDVGSSAFRRLDRFDRTVVVSLRWIGEHDGYHADRISSANIELELRLGREPAAADGLRFLSWNRFKTDYGEVDLGRLTSARSTSRSLEAGLDLPYGIQIKPGAEAETSATSEIQLRQRYISLTGNLQENEAQLFQHGASGIDVSGNIAIDLQIQVPSDRFDFTDFEWTETGHPVAIDKNVIVFPDSYEKPIVVQGVVRATIRHVVEGHETIVEADDVVAFCEYEQKLPPFEIVEQDDLYFKMAALWLDDPDNALRYALLAMPRDPSDTCDPNLIAIEDPDVRRYGIFLDSEDNAHRLLKWLRKPERSASQSGIRVDDRPLCLCPMIQRHEQHFGVPASQLGIEGADCEPLTPDRAKLLRVNHPDNRQVR